MGDYDAETDWIESGDDMDGQDWENAMGGPDEAYFEDQEQQAYQELYLEDLKDQSERASDHEDINRYADPDDEEPEEDERKKEIIAWLIKAPFTQHRRKKNEFFVLKDPIVQLQDGEEVNLIDWLLEEGFSDQCITNNYSVKHFSSKKGEVVKISFVRNVFKAPFKRTQKAGKVTNVRVEVDEEFWDDDIPY